MPEKNFELQARDMANGFNVEPKPEVWQNVHNAIQQPRGKRRVVLWWWLLPLGLLGGSIALYTFKAGNITAIANMDTLRTVTTPQQTIQLPVPIQQHKQEMDAKHSVKTDNSTTVSLPKNISSQQAQSKGTHNGTVAENLNKNEIQDKKTIIDKNVAGDNKIKEAKTDAMQKFVPVDSTPSAFFIDSKNNVIERENKDVNNNAEAMQSTLAAQQKDSLNKTSLSKDAAISSTAINSNTAASVAANVEKTTSPVNNTSDSSKGNKPALSPVKPSKPKLHWGLLVEGGIAARKSSLFLFAGMDKSNNVPQNSPNVNGSFSSLNGLPGSSNGYYYSNNIRQGAAIGLGVALQRKLSRNIDLFADVAYYYQSFKTSTTVYKDSLVLNLAFAQLAGNYEADQHFHFAALFAGIQWHFINTKHMEFGISAGADNIMLLAAKQSIKGVGGSNFSYADASRVSSYAVATSNFYTYQPSLFTGLLVNLKTGKKQLQVVPFARSSFRPFERNPASNNNHLFSAGVRAVYFFK